MTGDPGTTMRYSAPAVRWTDALPIGNGRLGAVCFGGVERDLFQLSDGTAFGQEPG
jgi:alpha-L-fucosidase 2